MLNNRRHPRVPAPAVGLVDVSVVKAGAWTQVGRALLADISKGGVSIHMDFAIHPGTKVRLNNRYVSYRATVRHCVKKGETFRLGLQFDAVPGQKAY
jgi:hypothetical protein